VVKIAIARMVIKNQIHMDEGDFDTLDKNVLSDFIPIPKILYH